MGEPYEAATRRQRRARLTGLFIGGLIAFMLGGFLGVFVYALVAVIAALFVLRGQGTGSVSRM